MKGNSTQVLEHFFVVGINYKKTDAAVRGGFALNQKQYDLILHQSKQLQLAGIMVLSTCNRTEIYGMTEAPEDLIKLWLDATGLDRKTLENHSYILSGKAAIEHLFEVAAGLDSQILGDYEIVGQIKNAFNTAKENRAVNSFIERLVNTVLQCSKNIRNQTKISSGSVSVSYAAVQFIKENISDLSSKSILLIGIGKLGRSTSKNIVDYLDCKKFVLINRTPEKAASLSNELGLKYAPIENLNEEITSADIILVAANASSPLISCAQLDISYGNKLIIDLSIPYNVESCVSGLAHIQLVNVDELSTLKDKTLDSRRAEIPKVKQLIKEHVTEFLIWNDLRKHVPVLSAVKSQLIHISLNPLFYPLEEKSLSTKKKQEKIQRVVNGMALKLKLHNRKGCHYIEAINEYINTADSES